MLGGKAQEFQDFHGPFDYFLLFAELVWRFQQGSQGAGLGTTVHAHLSIFQNRHGLEQPDVLKRPCNTVGDYTIASQSVEFFSSVGDRPFARRVNAGDHIKDSGLACTIGADEAQDLASWHLQVQAFNSMESTKPF